MSRISAGTMIVVVFAILFGLVGAYAVRKHLEKPEPQPEEVVVERPQQVPLAAADLDTGRPLTLDDIMVVSYTKEQIQQRNLPQQYMLDPQQIIGRILKQPIRKGESFHTTNLYPRGMGPSIAQRLREGQRAVTIDVHGIGLVNGFAGAGSFVDVLFRTNENEESGVVQSTVPLIEGVEVLALERNPVPNSNPGQDLSTITLAVTPQQATALKIVEGHGQFTLTLRSPRDMHVNTTSGPRTMEELLELPRKNNFVTEVYRGTQKSNVEFEMSDTSKRPNYADQLPVPGLPLRAGKGSKFTSISETE